MTRFVCLFALAFAYGAALAEEKKEERKLPDLKAKEWKDLKDADGMKVWDVKEGDGDAVKADETVTIHYTGWTTDGKVFDSSYKTGERAKFPLKSLIQGWQKGIPGMKPGGVRRLMIPPELGYGAQGSPPDIPGGATLVFEIELAPVPKMPDLKAKEWKDLKDADGMKVWDVKEGKGEACPEGAEVTIHYSGWLTDGTLFDSSVQKDKAFSTSLSRLIKGWQKGVPGMKEGGVRRLLIPYELAYGEDGRPPLIPAKATLVFEIELKKFTKDQ